MLEQAGKDTFAVDWVSTFEEAVDAFDEDSYDAYIVDYFLEDRSGLDLLREARRRGVQAPLIMLTGRGSPAVDQEALAAGAAGYLQKGQFEPAELERSIRYAIQQALPGGAPDSGHPDDLGEARFRAVFEACQSGIALVDLDGIIFDANRAFLGLVGSTAEEMRGYPFSDLLEKEDLPLALRDHGSLSRGEEDRVQADRRFRPSDGRPFSARTTYALIRTPSGHPDHVVVVMEESAGK
jgi:PAS domain S-box-containing protein